MGQNMGANAEYLIVPKKGMITFKPSNLDYAEASTLPYGMITGGSILEKVRSGPESKDPDQGGLRRDWFSCTAIGKAKKALKSPLFAVRIASIMSKSWS